MQGGDLLLHNNGDQISTIFVTFGTSNDELGTRDEGPEKLPYRDVKSKRRLL